MKLLGTITAFCLAASFAVCTAGTADSSTQLPSYKVASGVSGNLNSVGSDTLNNLMTLWAEGFSALYPGVNVGVEGKGSGTAPPALAAGTAQLGPMSRSMKKEEKETFKAAFGYEPVEVKVAIDALGVFVNKDNPVDRLSLTELDGIFSSTCKRGGAELSDWGSVPGGEVWQGRSISVYGRNSASGTNAFFKEHVLKKGDYKASVKEQPGSSAVVQGIASDMNGIGYSGIGYKTSGVKALSLSEKPGKKAYEPTYANCLNGHYPLSRFLVIYVNKKPGQPLDTLTREFLKFVLSKEGQAIVEKDGYFPLPAPVVEKTLESLEQ